MLVRGNGKLGDAIWAWNLPALDTCPGRTARCAAACYAERGNWCFASVRGRLALNLRAARHPAFADAMSLEIQTQEIPTVRIHGSGDFFDALYIGRWATIISRCRGTRFLVYTRSWRAPGLRQEIEGRLAPLQNLALWYSLDADTGTPEQAPPRVQLAWMQVEGLEDVPAQVALVFRTHRLRHRPQKRVGQALVCPKENGTAAGRRTTCTTCQFCLEPAEAEDEPAVRFSLPVVTP